MNMPTVKSLRARAITHSFFPPTDLKNALAHLKFVQADPIRFPARAQDLILRHRVENYRAGDLEREYPSLDIEEDFLYAYGFLTRDVQPLLHPRKTDELSDFEQNVLATVARLGDTHPKQLEAHFGSERVVNAWGGSSKATTGALEKLHRRGLLRIAFRASGIRVYQIVSPPVPTVAPEILPPAERLKQLILVIADIFAPVTERCLLEASAFVRRLLPQTVDAKTVISELLQSGALERLTADGIDYFLTPGKSKKTAEISPTVKFLAPFDLLVWDRRRFEHFWGWAYRFEAYTPPHKRLRGYYALPMLWSDDIIGWANARVQSGTLNVEIGFVKEKPIDPAFTAELEKEIERMKIFLNLRNSSSDEAAAHSAPENK